MSSLSEILLNSLSLFFSPLLVLNHGASFSFLFSYLFSNILWNERIFFREDFFFICFCLTIRRNSILEYLIIILNLKPFKHRCSVHLSCGHWWDLAYASKFSVMIFHFCSALTFEIHKFLCKPPKLGAEGDFWLTVTLKVYLFGVTTFNISQVHENWNLNLSG